MKMFKTQIADAKSCKQNPYEVIPEYLQFKNELKKRSNFWNGQEAVVPAVTHVQNMTLPYIQTHVDRLETYLREVDLGAVIDNWESIKNDIDSIVTMSVTHAAREHKATPEVKLESAKVSRAAILRAAGGLVKMRDTMSKKGARSLQLRRSSRKPKERELFNPDKYGTVKRASRLEMTKEQIEAFPAQKFVLDMTDVISSDEDL